MCSQVKVLKCIEPARLEETVLGQYAGDPNGANDDARHSYLDDPTVKKGLSSICHPLCCCLMLRVVSCRILSLCVGLALILQVKYY